MLFFPIWAVSRVSTCALSWLRPRNTQILEHAVKGLANMGECHRAMVRIVLGNQHMAVEAAHLRGL